MDMYLCTYYSVFCNSINAILSTFMFSLQVRCRSKQFFVGPPPAKVAAILNWKRPRKNNYSLRDQTQFYYYSTTNTRTEAINHTVETASPSFMEANSSILAVIEAVVIVSSVSAASTRHKRSAFASLRPILASGSIHIYTTTPKIQSEPKKKRLWKGFFHGKKNYNQVIRHRHFIWSAAYPNKMNKALFKI